MFESIVKFLKKITKSEQKEENSKNTAKERLHLVLMQDRANVSADFLEMMKQEILEVIKKYIEIDEKEIDVHLTNKPQEDGTNGAPFLYANIPILNIKSDMKKSEGIVSEERKVPEEKEKKVKQSNNKSKEMLEESQEENIAEVKEEKIESKEDKEKIKEEKTEIKESKEQKKEEKPKEIKKKTSTKKQIIQAKNKNFIST